MVQGFRPWFYLAGSSWGQMLLRRGVEQFWLVAVDPARLYDNSSSDTELEPAFACETADGRWWTILPSRSQWELWDGTAAIHWQ